MGSQKALALLCYLASHDGPVSRDRLIDLFWNDLTSEKARANLSWTLNRLNKVLPVPLHSDRQVVHRHKSASLWQDVVAFDELAQHGDPASLAEATALYRGEFAAGLVIQNCPEFDTWLQSERERWQHRITMVLESRISQQAQAGDLTAGIWLNQQVLAIMPWRESAHRNLMQLLAQAGQRSEALAQYARCRETLAAEYGVEPEQETEELVQQIRNGLHRTSPGAPPRQRIRVVIVEDQDLFRDLLVHTLNSFDNIAVVGDFASGAQALAQVPALRPDVVLLDISLGDSLNGIEVGLRLREQLPHLGVVLLSNYQRATILNSVPEDAINGWSYLTKTEMRRAESLRLAIEGTAAGLVIFNPSNTPQAGEQGSPIATLTFQQREIVERMALGYSDTVIADQLRLPLAVLDAQITVICEKLGTGREGDPVQPRVRAVLALLKRHQPDM